MGKLRLTRLVMMEECPWLDRDFEAGEIVYPFNGATYGCIGPDGRAVSHDPDAGPFFELPRNALKEHSNEA